MVLSETSLSYSPSYKVAEGLGATVKTWPVPSPLFPLASMKEAD